MKSFCMLFVLFFVSIGFCAPLQGKELKGGANTGEANTGGVKPSIPGNVTTDDESSFGWGFSDSTTAVDALNTKEEENQRSG